MNKSLIVMAVLTAFTAGAAQAALVQVSLGGAWLFEQSSVDYLDDDVQSLTARLDLTAGDRVLFSIFLTDYLDADGYPDTGYGGNVTVSLGNWRRRAPVLTGSGTPFVRGLIEICPHAHLMQPFALGALAGALHAGVRIRRRLAVGLHHDALDAPAEQRDLAAVARAAVAGELELKLPVERQLAVLIAAHAQPRQRHRVVEEGHADLAAAPVSGRAREFLDAHGAVPVPAAAEEEDQDEKLRERQHAAILAQGRAATGEGGTGDYRVHEWGRISAYGDGFDICPRAGMGTDLKSVPILI